MSTTEAEPMLRALRADSAPRSFTRRRGKEAGHAWSFDAHSPELGPRRRSLEEASYLHIPSLEPTMTMGSDWPTSSSTQHQQFTVAKPGATKEHRSISPVAYRNRRIRTERDWRRSFSIGSASISPNRSSRTLQLELTAMYSGPQCASFSKSQNKHSVPLTSDLEASQRPTRSNSFTSQEDSEMQHCCDGEHVSALGAHREFSTSLQRNTRQQNSHQQNASTRSDEQNGCQQNQHLLTSARSNESKRHRHATFNKAFDGWLLAFFVAVYLLTSIGILLMPQQRPLL